MRSTVHTLAVILGESVTLQKKHGSALLGNISRRLRRAPESSIHTIHPCASASIPAAALHHRYVGQAPKGRREKKKNATPTAFFPPIYLLISIALPTSIDFVHNGADNTCAASSIDYRQLKNKQSGIGLDQPGSVLDERGDLHSDLKLAPTSVSTGGISTATIPPPAVRALLFAFRSGREPPVSELLALRVCCFTNPPDSPNLPVPAPWPEC